MNNEIKEILDDLRKTADNGIFIVCSSQEELDKMPKYTTNFLSINDRKAKLLLDYITNLQEENKRLKEYQENYRKELDYWRIQFSNKEDRIDKAIDIIKEVLFIGVKDYRSQLKIIEDILKGSEE